MKPPCLWRKPCTRPAVQPMTLSTLQPLTLGFGWIGHFWWKSVGNFWQFGGMRCNDICLLMIKATWASPTTAAQRDGARGMPVWATESMIGIRYVCAPVLPWPFLIFYRRCFIQILLTPPGSLVTMIIYKMGISVPHWHQDASVAPVQPVGPVRSPGWIGWCLYSHFDLPIFGEIERKLSNMRKPEIALWCPWWSTSFVCGEWQDSDHFTIVFTSHRGSTPPWWPCLKLSPKLDIWSFSEVFPSVLSLRFQVSINQL